MSEGQAEEKHSLSQTWEYTLNRIFNTVDTIISKMTSGKFIATVLVVWTYCQTISVCGNLAVIGKIQPETYIAILAGIAGLATMIVKDYFARGSNEESLKK